MNESDRRILDQVASLRLVDEQEARNEAESKNVSINPTAKERTFHKRRSKKFDEVAFELILPFGSGQAYSIDNGDHVSGIKLGSLGKNGSSILDLLANLPNLRRAVIYSNTPLEVTERFADVDLEMVWFGGEILTIPERIFTKKLLVHVEAKQTRKSLMQEVLSPAAFNLMTFLSEGTTDKDAPPNITQRTEADIAQTAEFAASSEELRSLRGIFISSTEIADPPFEIVSRGSNAIVKYFAERGSGSLPLNELKVILVGNGGAGKTSLVKKIVGEKFDPKEKQTHGISITKWSMTTRDDSISLNSWDFGGQEIMHATHQFFLSKRSVYILVLDGRKDEDPEYWLQHIESFGGDSPIFVVLNKIDEHPAFEVNRRFLLGKYKGIVDFFRISCSKNTGVEDLLERLRMELPKMSMLQTRWPNSWFQVKRAIEARNVPFIALNDYTEVCNKFHIEQESQELLVDFLHDLGIVLHFKDIQLLDTHVLDPKWVTEGVYRIINSSLVASNKGILPLEKLSQVLKKPSKQKFDYPPEKHSFLIDLMLKFEVCYELGKADVLIPDLLDIQEPEIAFDTIDTLQFILEYAYFPKSIMPRFIVRVHSDIKDGKRWRTGVLLRDKAFDATALVRADEKAKRIYMLVNGPQRRDYFSALRKVISDINASFERLTVTEYVPLPDNADILIEYKELLGHEKAGRSEMFVGRVEKSYDVQTMLNGVELPAARRVEQIVNIGGNYYAAPTVSQSVTNQVSIEEKNLMNHTPAAWEKVFVYVAGAAFLSLVGYLLIRNVPIADPNLVVALRVILSLVIAAFGAAIPGFLHVDFSARGLTIRAAGALALFVIAYVATPQVLHL